MDSITRQIAEYSCGMTFDDLSDDSVHAARQRLIDSLGCAVGAHDCEPAADRQEVGDGTRRRENTAAGFCVTVINCRPSPPPSSIRR